MTYDQAIKRLKVGDKVALGHWIRHREFLIYDNDESVLKYLNGNLSPFEPNDDEAAGNWLIVFVQHNQPSGQQ
jgi:hypothetical protein